MSVSVVGLHGGHWYGPSAETALRSADLLVGAALAGQQPRALELQRERGQ